MAQKIVGRARTSSVHVGQNAHWLDSSAPAALMALTEHNIYLNNNVPKRTVMNFNAAGGPAASDQVEKAVLIASQSPTFFSKDSPPVVLEVRRVTETWAVSVNSPTWTNKTLGVAWTVAGGTYDTTTLEGVQAFDDHLPVNIEVTDMVRDWIDDADWTKGCILKFADEDIGVGNTNRLEGAGSVLADIYLDWIDYASETFTKPNPDILTHYDRKALLKDAFGAIKGAQYKRVGWAARYNFTRLATPDRDNLLKFVGTGPLFYYPDSTAEYCRRCVMLRDMSESDFSGGRHDIGFVLAEID